MPLIKVQLLPGRTREQKKDLVESLTRETCRAVGCPPEAVVVVIEEQPTENWGFGGVHGPEKYPGR